MPLLDGVEYEIEKENQMSSHRDNASQKFMNPDPKKPSVLYKPAENEEHPMTNGFYLNREFAAKKLGEKNLNKAKGVEVTVRLIY
jgi:hypothetical protein